MPNLQTTNESDRAAEAFYGQSESAFAQQIAEICGNDPRLITAFERTRDRYLKSKAVKCH
jgi:hypothetical protein